MIRQIDKRHSSITPDEKEKEPEGKGIPTVLKGILCGGGEVVCYRSRYNGHFHGVCNMCNAKYHV